MKHHHLLASSFCLILASTVTGVLGFTAGSRSSPSSLLFPSVQARTVATALQSSSAAANDYYNPNHSSPSLLELASQCATSDSCSVDSAYSYLREIFHAQSGCIAMTGNPNVDSAMCVNVDVVAEVVANLRNKISSSSSNNVAAAHRRAEDDALLPPPLSAVMTAAAIVVAAEIMTLLIHSNSNMAASGAAASPITIQEMYWAIRDGYVGDVMTHVFRNAGLLLVTDDANNIVMDTTSSILSTTTTATSSLTPQELYWSVRDGYVGDTLLASSRGIGDSSGSGIVPFTPQEVYWAIRNGYVNDLTLHLFRNGGLLM